MSNELIIKAHRNAVKQLEAVGNDVDKLPAAVKTVILVHAAQGIIDNGALQYFFENDWPGRPKYSVFSNAYRQIGANECADLLDRAVELLAIENPERHPDLRQQRMEELCEQDVSEFAGLSGKLCSDKSVWEKLSQFIECNGDVLLAKANQ